ncbi:16S rRNA (guanine(527)-N(7))-methyltransferase RsmG [Paracoccus laeviglucosivorans]|uniref:Ribosomal RNA small subunit methyltransferase G n=1 Tax=Paracoccus laeviglucosivorans TaxID=1197861 RepID=A0A521FI31_9RHOB|nr:16S rRNA (guanine(527)-N(7))-methyltransferase RsmG [Paracoccus laeviglucosivorans]SMO95863.1 16S rRNA m(7)G-527 methyltransferase [Paracoccus laeviglucosivorans]
MNVSRETQLLQQFAVLLRKWNPAINLVSPNTVSEIESRHIEDSLQISAFAAGASDWTDIGSGGGLPGLVLAISRPALAVTLVESDQRKSAFLRTAIRELGLNNVRVICDRIEAVDPLGAANLSARALAPLPLLLSYAVRHLDPAGTAWLMKGKNWAPEVEQARVDWVFDVESYPSKTDPDAVILKIAGIKHV